MTYAFIMSCKISFAFKHLNTKKASVWTRISMRPQMNGKVTTGLQSFSTITNVLCTTLFAKFDMMINPIIFIFLTYAL